MTAREAATRLASSVRWSLAAELVAAAGLPVAMLVLSRLLAPEDFGVVTAAALVVSLSQLISEAGMGKALVRLGDGIEEAATGALCVNVGLAAIAGAVLLASADRIAVRLFDDARVADVLRVMTVGLVLAAGGAAPLALLRRAMQFRRLFHIQLLTGLFPMLAAIPFAWAGAGFWALVAGGLAGQALATAALWRAAGWRPRRLPDRAAMRKLVDFGAWSGVSALLAWAFIWADALVIGMFLGAVELGVFRSGNQIVVALFGALLSPLLPVLYSHLATLQHQPDRLRAAWAQAVRLAALVAFPLGFLLAGASGLAEAALFDERWSGIGTVIAYMALAHALAWLVGANGEALRAAGKPQAEFAAMLGGIAVYLPVYWIFARHGLEVFLAARLTVTFWGVAVQLYVVRRVIGAELAPAIRFAALAAAASAPLLLLTAIEWRAAPGAAAAVALPVLVAFVVAMVFFARGAAAGELRLLLSLGRR